MDGKVRLAMRPLSGRRCDLTACVLISVALVGMATNDHYGYQTLPHPLQFARVGERLVNAVALFYPAGAFATATALSVHVRPKVGFSEGAAPKPDCGEIKNLGKPLGTVDPLHPPHISHHKPDHLLLPLQHTSASPRKGVASFRELC